MSESEYVKHESLAAALAAFQGELPSVGKGKTANVKSDKGSYSYNYADLADVAKAGHPVMSRHGLSFSSKPMLNDEGKFVLYYVLRHDSGQEDAGEFPLPSSGNMQAIGAALTYSRRYVLCAVTGIVADEDTDGRDAGEIRTESPRRGRTMQRQASRNENSQDTSEAGRARDALQSLATEQGLDWIAVRKAFAKQAGEPLANHQNAEFIRGFTKTLREHPQHVLATSTENGEASEEPSQ